MPPEDNNPPRALRIDVFSDLVCPWCFVGTERVEQVVAAIAPAVVARWVHHPFLLQPDTPPEGGNIHEMLRRKYGQDPSRLFAAVEAEAKKSGIPLDLSRQPFDYPTLAAHTLIRHADEKGTARAFERAVYRAYFLDARNIARLDVLLDVACAHGFDASEVERIVTDEHELAITRAEVDEAIERGVRGVPLFIFNGQVVLSGVQPEEAFKKAITKALGAIH